MSLIGGCTGSSDSTLVKIPQCWKSHVEAHSVATAQSLYNTSHYNTDLDIAWSVAPIFLPWNFTKELMENNNIVWNTVCGHFQCKLCIHVLGVHISAVDIFIVTLTSIMIGISMFPTD